MLSTWLACLGTLQGGVHPLTTLDLRAITQGWGQPQVNKSVDGRPIKIGTKSFATGLGSHASMVWRLKLDGKAVRFTSWVGVDAEVGTHGSVVFQVFCNGKLALETRTLEGGEEPLFIDVPLKDVKELLLVVKDGGDDINYDHADWAEATIETAGATPVSVMPPVEKSEILTPKPKPSPRLNNPTIYGARPGNPFLFRIPCQGLRPISFKVEGLPEGITLDAKEGILRGTTPTKRGTYTLNFFATNAKGKARKSMKLVVGDTLALTPPMGWNSWNAHYDKVTDAYMRKAADAMVSSGLADAGFAYVNVDDCWMTKKGDARLRDENGRILTNSRFPDMKAMADYIHRHGLKAGLYTSPGPWTCAGYTGAWQHEAIDAQTFAEWGFDFLKYDWCSYEGVATLEGRPRFEKPYVQMGDLLKKQKRDILLNMCQYGMDKVWEWGGSVGGHTWRTTGDIPPNNFWPVAAHNMTLTEFAKPGQWNDPDYLVLGWYAVGDGGTGVRATHSPNEQYSYVTLWSLMAAPFFYSGDMTRLDDFTKGLLTNPEVIEVNQDELGKQARVIRQMSDAWILAKPLANGDVAIGVVNPGEFDSKITFTKAELGLKGDWTSRDVWRMKDRGPLADKTTLTLRRKSSVFWRLRKSS